MTTQYTQALAGTITPEMTAVATRENLPVETIREELAAGRLVIPANRLHLEGLNGGVKLAPCAIGRAVTTKINANIGASPVGSCKQEELLKEFAKLEKDKPISKVKGFFKKAGKAMGV